MAELLSITRPADTTAYAVADLIANSTTAGSVTPFSFVLPAMGQLRSVRFHSTNTTTFNARLWLLSASPTVTNGDNGALAGSFVSTVRATYVGTIDRALTDGVHGHFVAEDGEPLFNESQSPLQLYGLLEARSAFTPVSGVTMNIAPRFLSL